MASFDGAHHPFGLAVGPRVVRLGEPVLDAVLRTDTAEDMADPAQRTALVPLNELHPIVGEDGVDPIGHRLDQHTQERCRGELRRPPIDTGEHQLRGAIHRHIKKALAAFVAQFGDVDMEVADLIFFELLRLLTIRLR